MAADRKAPDTRCDRESLRRLNAQHRSHSGVFMAVPLTAYERQAGRPAKDAPLANGLEKSGAASEPIFDLIGPVSLEAQQGGVHPREVVAWNASDLFDRARMLLIDASDDTVHLLAPLG